MDMLASTKAETPVWAGGAATFKSDDEKKAVAERLREAVVNGSGTDINNLFQECTAPAKAVQANANSDRFAALMDEDSLNTLLVEPPAPTNDLQKSAYLQKSRPIERHKL